MVEKIKTSRKSQIPALAALLLFVAATFQIADGSILPGVILFASATCFSSVAGICHKREASEEGRDISR